MISTPELEVNAKNFIYDQLTVENGTNSEYGIYYPNWNLNTILNCTFNGTLQGGNITESFGSSVEFKIKRRKKGDFDWITIGKIELLSYDLKFAFKDYYNQANTEYEYAFVPVVNNVEGSYIIGDVHSEFNSVFILDKNTNFKLLGDVGYDGMESMQKIQIYEPIGGKYPIIVSNGDTDYKTGAVKATLLPNSYYADGKIDRKQIVEYSNQFDAFLKNKKAKILKDWNGNIYLCYITQNPTYNYDNNYGMGIVGVAFKWTEQGDPNNAQDLYLNGFIDEV